MQCVELCQAFKYVETARLFDHIRDPGFSGYFWDQDCLALETALECRDY